MTEPVYSVAIVCHFIVGARRECLLKFAEATLSLREGKVENDQFSHCTKMTESE